MKKEMKKETPERLGVDQCGKLEKQNNTTNPTHNTTGVFVCNVFPRNTLKHIERQQN